MSQLAAQNIEALVEKYNLITPFSAERFVVNGKSGGLSAASYDMTIGHDLVLGVNPAYIIRDHVIDHGFGEVDVLRERLQSNPPHTALAYTNEDLAMPTFVSAQVADKSTYARVFCSAFNTFIDPGFRGNLTLELVNHGEEPVVIRAGDPIVQLLFTSLLENTDRPYTGKYMHQTKAAHGARYEEPTK